MKGETHLLQRLLDAGLLSREQADQLVVQQKKSGMPLIDCISESRVVPDHVLGQIQADYYQVPYIDLKKRTIIESTLRLIPELVAKKQLIIPFHQDDERVALAMNDPHRADLISYVEKETGKRIDVSFATKENIFETLALYKTHLQQDIEKLLESKRVSGDGIIKLLDTLLAYAYVNKASDIHIEPQEKKVEIRFRIDGELHDVATLNTSIENELVSRVKILSRLRTDEHTSAQDGRFHSSIEGNEADVRVSVVPTTHGEKIVMRILTEGARGFSLEEISLNADDLEIVKRNMSRPYGMILATGPTGAGKTSTLYAMLKILNERSVNISTIEDPVEYQIDGVNQIQVNPNTNLTFAHGLKSILRQDPDIIMVGEIRDDETAGIAINAALTGHLVLSTLHTNDAPTTLPRLLDMGIEPFLIASTINLAIAQRLVRKIHQPCMESYVIGTDEVRRLTAELSPQERTKLQLNGRAIRLFKGKGCDLCHHTGFEGRIGIFELLECTEAIKALIIKRAHSNEIRAAAEQEHMHSMYFDGLQKALEGKTTIEEVIRATHL